MPNNVFYYSIFHTWFVLIHSLLVKSHFKCQTSMIYNCPSSSHLAPFDDTNKLNLVLLTLNHPLSISPTFYPNIRPLRAGDSISFTTVLSVLVQSTTKPEQIHWVNNVLLTSSSFRHRIYHRLGKVKEITYLSFQILSCYPSLYVSCQIVLINPENPVLLQRKISLNPLRH